MIKYKKYQNKNAKSAAYNKWYGRAVHELMEFDEFIEHMANHHCVFSEGTIKGVLIEMQFCLRELLLEGKAVRLDDLGIFALGLETQGEDTSAKFTSDSIKAVHMNLYLGRRFRARELYAAAKFKEADKYVGDGNYYEPDGGEMAGTGGNLPDTDNEQLPDELGGEAEYPAAGGSEAGYSSIGGDE